MKKVGLVIAGIIFLLGLVYVMMPGATTINDIAAIPGSTKSMLDGDTWQNPNIAAYFSDWNRAQITQYYRQIYDQTLFHLPSIRVNHPPEDAKVFIRDQQESTFLEEYIHPLRDSLYVNGYEPAIENAMYHTATGFVGDHIYYGKTYYASKTTLRYYPSQWWARLFNYLAIWGVGYLLVMLFMRAIRKPA